jgi:hypothetical protein
MIDADQVTPAKPMPHRAGADCLGLALVLSLALFAGGASGASSLITEVRAADGGYVAGAIVLLTGPSLSRLSMANKAGQVQFLDLPAATYALKLSAEGFTARTIDDVVLPAGAQKVLMVSLDPTDGSGVSVGAAIGPHAFDRGDMEAIDVTPVIGAETEASSGLGRWPQGGGLYGRVDLLAARQTLPRFPSTAGRVAMGGDIPLLSSPGDVALQGVSVEAGAQTGQALPLLSAVSDNVRLVVNVEHLSGSTSASGAVFEVPEPLSVTFTGVDPASNAAGTVLPAGGDVRSRIKVRTRDQALRVGAAWDWGSAGDGGNRIGSSLMLGYGELEQDIRRSDTFGRGESSLDDVVIDQERATVDLSLFGQRPFGNGRFSLYGELGVRWQHASSDMQSSYHYRGDPVVADVARTTRDSLSDTSLGAYAGIEVGYRVGRATVLSVSAKVAEGNAVPTLATPDRTGREDIRLRHSDDERRESFGIGLLHAF